MSLKTLNKILESGVKLTPMMQQYYDIKCQYPDMLLLYRMGDFYEMFFDDAVEASQILNISLTHRGKIADMPIPMCGIPHHAAATYIDRITERGLKAAICDQLEDPKFAKGLVKRGITQIVSPGMPYDLDKTEKNDQRFMIATGHSGSTYSLIAMDFTTGKFFGSKHKNVRDLIEAIRLVAPKELITYMGQWDHDPEFKNFLDKSELLVTHLSEDYFISKYTGIYIEKIVPAYTHDKVIGNDEALLSALGALSYYVLSTQGINELIHIQPFKLESDAEKLNVTLSTLIGLEILPKSRDRYQDSLLGFFDRTKTAMGGRKLKYLFLNPLRNLTTIKTRQKIIQYFIDNSDSLEFIRGELQNVRDLERIMAKTTTGKINASDIINISRAVQSYCTIVANLPGFPEGAIDELNPSVIGKLKSIADQIEITINDEIGASLEKGNLIKPGCNEERDKLADLSANWADKLLELENRYKEETGIPKLRIKSNNINGHFIEVTNSYTSQVPAYFMRRQTLVNTERYTTEELITFEKEVFASKEKLERLEKAIFKNLVEEIESLSREILMLAEYLMMIDCFQSFAYMAMREDLVCPTLVDGEKILEIKGSWHPLIRAAIKDKFVTHDLTLNEHCYFGLITGPNMAGKTTVMREVAIIQLLAQIGAYVPAGEAHLGVVDYIFSRLGASDDILQGQSTFMVEMSETAEIIRHATDKSLIILDEVGRGTSTYDGLSIAWALVEHFEKNTQALTLFATHYHELIDLANTLDHAKNLTVETVEHNGDVKFLYRLIEQGASQSYGIFVARLAGLPNTILKRSASILKKLERVTSKNELIVNTLPQLDMFQANEETVNEEKYEPLRNKIKDIKINELTPLEAMNKLAEIIKINDDL